MSGCGALVDKTTGVKGFLPTSMLDWEGSLVAVLFTGGCNFRCPFCHNAELVLGHGELSDVPWERIATLFKKKSPWLDGVCITGGEPTIAPHLDRIASEIKKEGLKVKLDTNGTNPSKLERLMDRGLIDYVAMDVKTVFDKYHMVTDMENATDQVRRSIEVLVEWGKRGVEVEFRTTAVPGFADFTDIHSIAQYLGGRGAKRYTIQRYRFDHVLDPKTSPKETYSKEQLERLAARCAECLPTKVR